MKNILYASISFLSILLIFIIQNVLFITSSSLVYLYETISGLELYATLCFLYFSLRMNEQKSKRKISGLFPKVFSPAFLFSFAVLFDLDFNKITLLTSTASIIFVVTGFLVIAFALFKRQPIMVSSTVLQNLSKREQEVASLILQGKTTQETADALFVSLSTVKTHIQHIYEKTGARNRAELAQIMQNHTSTR